MENNNSFWQWIFLFQEKSCGKLPSISSLQQYSNNFFVYRSRGHMVIVFNNTKNSNQKCWKNFPHGPKIIVFLWKFYIKFSKECILIQSTNIKKRFDLRRPECVLTTARITSHKRSQRWRYENDKDSRIASEPLSFSCITSVTKNQQARQRRGERDPRVKRAALYRRFARGSQNKSVEVKQAFRSVFLVGLNTEGQIPVDHNIA